MRHRLSHMLISKHTAMPLYFVLDDGRKEGRRRWGYPSSKYNSLLFIAVPRVD